MTMHKGNPYPFHPTYWATECQFYPGLVPWRLFLVGLVGGNATFAPVYSRVGLPSQIGLAPGDATQISWNYSFLNSGHGYTFTLSLELVEDAGVKYAQWAGRQRKDGVDVNKYRLRLPFPQRVLDTGASVWTNTFTTDTGLNDITCRVRGATYGEGGSPW